MTKMTDSLTAYSPFTKHDMVDLLSSEWLSDWQPEKVCDIGYPIFSDRGLQVLVAYGKNDLKKLYLAILPIKWQACTIAKLLSWSSIHPDTLPTSKSIPETVEALRAFAKKLVAEPTNASNFEKDSTWPSFAFEYLKKNISGKVIDKESTKMLYFAEWATLPPSPLIEIARSVSASSTDEPTHGPSGKKRKINHANHDLMKFITNRNGEVARKVDEYLTENENLSKALAEKQEGINTLQTENKRLKEQMDEKDKEIAALVEWSNEVSALSQKKPKVEKKNEAEAEAEAKK